MYTSKSSFWSHKIQRWLKEHQEILEYNHQNQLCQVMLLAMSDGVIWDQFLTLGRNICSQRGQGGLLPFCFCITRCLVHCETCTALNKKWKNVDVSSTSALQCAVNPPKDCPLFSWLVLSCRFILYPRV